MKKNAPILIRGCRAHNLANFSVELPKNQLIVVTGVSGSGKSSLAFDTLFAEGQRRYMESLSTRYRAFLRQLPRPDVDYIEGLSPTLAVEQNSARISRRATVGTQTDIYDLLALLFARVGIQHSPTTGAPLSRQSKSEIVEAILTDYPEGSAIQLLAPTTLPFDQLEKMGYIRLRVAGEEVDLSESTPKKSDQVEVVVDRLRLKPGIRERLADSVALALQLGRGVLTVLEKQPKAYTEVYLCPETGETFPPLTPANFNFNSIHGACPTCQGSGLDCTRPFSRA